MQLSCLAVNSNRWTFLHRALWVLSHFSRVWLFGTLWTAAHHTPQSMGFSREEYCSGLPCPSPGDLPNPGIEPASLVSLPLAGGFFTTSTTNVLVKLGHFSSPAYGHVWGFGDCVCVYMCVCACVHTLGIASAQHFDHIKPPLWYYHRKVIQLIGLHNAPKALGPLPFILSALFFSLRLPGWENPTESGGFLKLLYPQLKWKQL